MAKEQSENQEVLEREKKGEGNRFLKILGRCLLVAPLLLGFYGFLQLEGVSPSWAMYYAVNLYAFQMSIDQVNVWIEIARWTAPLVTATAILYVLQDFYIRVKKNVRALKKGSCSVYGDTEDAGYFLEKLGKTGIRGDLEHPVNSAYHVVMTGDNSDSLDFYDRYSEKFQGKWKKSHVFLQLKGISPMTIQKENVTGFSLERDCAMEYWRKHPALAKEKIGFIGSDDLCDALLEQGLLVNIADKNQLIAYHVWSKDDHFAKMHPKLSEALSETGDSIVFYPEEWWEHLDMLKQMNRIILCGKQEDNLLIADKLLQIIIEADIHIYTREGHQIAALFDVNRLSFFGHQKELLTKEVILQEKLLQDAVNMHNKYRGLYPDMKSWEEIDTFKRLSNVAATSYFPVIRRLYGEYKEQLEKKSGSFYEGLSPEVLAKIEEAEEIEAMQGGTETARIKREEALDEMIREALQEMEHIRWNRFHFMHNWSFCEVRDDSKKLHDCLRPYTELSELNRKKDRSNVDMALTRPEETYMNPVNSYRKE